MIELLFWHPWQQNARHGVARKPPRLRGFHRVRGDSGESAAGRFATAIAVTHADLKRHALYGYADLARPTGATARRSGQLVIVDLAPPRAHGADADSNRRLKPKVPKGVQLPGYLEIILAQRDWRTR